VIADTSRDSRADRDIEVHVCNFLDLLLLDRRCDLGALFGGGLCHCRRGCGIAGRLAVKGRRLGLGMAAITRLPENFQMKRLLLMGVVACALVAMPTLSASAMPRATADTLIAGSDSQVIFARGGHGHGRGHMHRVGRGHHYGWGRGHHRGRR
jgi:hypothetical protein